MIRLKAVVFDWAGTVVDFGSRAPMGVFVEAFARFGVDVTIAEARGPMGRPKWDHIRAMFDVPRIAAAWAERHGAAPTDADVDRLYEVFVPLNEAVVADYADLVPGAAETVARLRARGLKIGSTTATPARSWSGWCRSPPPRASRRTISSAPATCPRGGRRR